MKTITLLIAITALSLSANSQTSPVYKKAIAIPESGLVCVAPSSLPEDKDCFKMVNNQMHSVRGNIAFLMSGYRWLKNGTVVNQHGKITTGEGQIIYLQNEESIDGLGVITSSRCAELAGENAVFNVVGAVK